MPIITGIEIENFRCFPKFSVAGLTRVNLIVGGNNSGKTVLLEALQWAVDRGNAWTIYKQLERRDEYAANEEVGHGVDLSSLFYGVPQRLTATDRFSVALELKSGKAEVATASIVPVNKQLFLRFSWSAARAAAEESGELAQIEIKGARIGKGYTGNAELKRAVFIGSNVANLMELKTVFAKLGASRSKIRARDAMKLLDPRIEAFEFVPSYGGRPDTFEILLKGEENGHPIGRFGEGIRRAARLAFALGEAQGSVLLLDEIENGVHYSAMPQIWKFMVRAAIELDAQIFVTSHSKDVLETIAQLRDCEPELANEISVHRLEAGRPTSVRISAEGVLGAIESDQEVR